MELGEIIENLQEIKADILKEDNYSVDWIVALNCAISKLTLETTKMVFDAKDFSRKVSKIKLKRSEDGE